MKQTFFRNKNFFFPSNYCTCVEHFIQFTENNKIGYLSERNSIFALS